MKHALRYTGGSALIGGLLLFSCAQEPGPLSPNVVGEQATGPAVATRAAPGGTRSIRSAEALAQTPVSVRLPDGRVAERRVHIFYKEGFSHKPNHPGGGGKGGDQCYAFIASGARWKTTESYGLDPANQDGLADVGTRLEASLNAWDDQIAFDLFGPNDPGLTIDGADTGTPDGKNEVLFGNIEDPGVIAVTITWGIFSGPPFARELVEWDMVLDDPDFAWGDAGPTSETTLGDISVMDFQNIVTHEAGHAAGLGHPSDACTEETMYRFAQAGETKKRTLHAGDIAGIKALYK
jgi:hypothetical protein